MKLSQAALCKKFMIMGVDCGAQLKTRLNAIGVKVGAYISVEKNGKVCIVSIDGRLIALDNKILSLVCVK